MSIYEDIRKVTQIPQTDENPLFVCRGEQNTLKRRQKFRKPKSPRNMNLYDLDDEDSANGKYNVIHHEAYIPENEITLAIRKANCGVNYSNEGIEQRWRIRQAKACLSSDIDAFQNAAVGKNDDKTLPIEGDDTVPVLDTSSNERKDTEEEEYVLKKCKLNKNAVIRGLLKHHKISLQDLQMPNDCMGATCSNSANIQEENVVPQSDLCKESHENAQWSDDPEAFVHPLLPYGTIDETKYKNIDFTVPHIGKKKKVTARQFFINIDDSNFNFVKLDSKKK